MNTTPNNAIEKRSNLSLAWRGSKGEVCIQQDRKCYLTVVPAAIEPLDDTTESRLDTNADERK
jgi:hypothetical protein